MNTPELIMLEGEIEKVSTRDLIRLNNDPSLLGVWVTAALTAAKGAGGIAKRIISARKKKKAKAKKKKTAAAPAARTAAAPAARTAARTAAAPAQEKAPAFKIDNKVMIAAAAAAAILLIINKQK